MRVKTAGMTAGMFIAAILGVSASGCAAGFSGAETPADVPAPELADDSAAITDGDAATRPRNEAAPTTAREFNGTETNPANRPGGGPRNDPYLPPQAVVPAEPAPQPPTGADTTPPLPPESSERPRPTFPRVTEPVPLLPFPSFGAGDNRTGQGDEAEGTGESTAPTPTPGTGTTEPSRAPSRDTDRDSARQDDGTGTGRAPVGRIPSTR